MYIGGIIRGHEGGGGNPCTFTFTFPFTGPGEAHAQVYGERLRGRARSGWICGLSDGRRARLTVARARAGKHALWASPGPVNVNVHVSGRPWRPGAMRAAMARPTPEFGFTFEFEFESESE
jgi:hypothetical protein